MNMRRAQEQSYLQPNPPPDADPQRPSGEFLLWAYAHGLFPMVDSTNGVGADRVEWFCPDPRGILPLDPPETFHIPKNLQRILRRNDFEIRSNTVFEQVIRACDEPRSEDNRSWLNQQLIQAYVALHRLGHAHSVEAWRNGRLVGGLYGVQIGAAFFGESMFSRPDIGGSNSSKVCLVHLVRWLRSRGFTLLDTQFWNEHLDQFGCIEIPAVDYLNLLGAAIRGDTTWGDFQLIMK